MRRSRIIVMVALGYLLIAGLQASAQDPMSRFRGMGGGGAKSGDTTLKHRVEDSINISFRFLDSSRLRRFDSTIYDFRKKFPLQATWIDLGNFGTASRNLVFTPIIKSGWDPGWHAYDAYVFTTDETRFYTTTRPYSELGYVLGGKAEQMVNLVHTQNIKQLFNFSFQYRLINNPGTYNNQNTNHNNYRVSAWYNSANKRYHAFLILVGSKLVASENGGLKDTKDLDSIAYTDRFNILTRLAPGKQYSTNVFASNVTTGTFYSTGTYLFRQQYDIIGKKDSIVTDSTVTRLFYPKIRAEHTISYSTYHYRFVDNTPDTSYYTKYFDFVSTPDTIKLSDQWHDLVNDLSFYSFPDSKNAQQFIKAGASIENLTGYFDAGSKTLYNVFVHGEYRNKTRNQKWDVEAIGKFYVTGYNAGDYNAYISLKRMISKNLGFLQVGFQNSNRTPSFSYDRESSFGFGVPGFFNKENIVNLFGSIEQPKLDLKLSGSYFLITNYNYFTDYYHAKQQSSPFNVLQLTLEKVFTYKRHWIWRLLLTVQQKAGSSPVNMPSLVTFNQFGYEGKLGFKNLNIAFGAELRYFSAYKADGFAPPVGQFFVQNDETIRQKLPDINLYINFRIRSFTAYVRAENLNTMQFNGPGGFGFTNNNFVAPYYPYPGLHIRLGIFWSFIN
ncbi:MAG: hypothetical protein JST75_16755 [Bacteroidetes bacterium]|nr:hypothetical protein [Bacteroidota bacterium]